MNNNDTILDPITFDDIVAAVRFNAKVINRAAVITIAREILESRIDTFEYLLSNNADAIVTEAMKGRS